MIEQKLVEVIAETLQVDAGRIGEDSGIENPPEWDSLAQLNLILAVEEVFGVRFSTAAVPQLNSVAALRKDLHEKGAQESA
jgi:acyl carrier protein